MHPVSSTQKKIMLEMANTIDKNILKVLRIATQIDRHNPNLRWLKGEISMAVQMDPMLLTNKIKYKMVDFVDRIRERDEQFFQTSEVFLDEKYIKFDERRDFMISFVRMIQASIAKITQEKKVEIWDSLNQIVDCLIEFRDTDPNDPFKK